MLPPLRFIAAICLRLPKAQSPARSGLADVGGCGLSLQKFRSEEGSCGTCRPSCASDLEPLFVVFRAQGLRSQIARSRPLNYQHDGVLQVSWEYIGLGQLGKLGVMLLFWIQFEHLHKERSNQILLPCKHVMSIVP